MTTSFLWVAAVMGAVSLLTPCVFPMIPITIAYFSNRSDTTRRDVALHAILFGLGIVTTFTALGLGLAIVVGASGISQFAADPWVNIAIGLVFIAFATRLRRLMRQVIYKRLGLGLRGKPRPGRPVPAP